MKRIEFLYTKGNVKESGFLTISDPVFDPGMKNWFSEVFCSIDNRNHKLFGVDKEQAVELAKGFVVSRYENFELRKKDGTPFVI